jgi:uncharacterized protein involved in oxidation of intracellular sulfur
MKLGIILQSNIPEHVWNAFRLANTALKAAHTVEIFLLNEGSELDTVSDTDYFDISNKVADFKAQGGVLLACGTCLKLRGQTGHVSCPVATMSDLLKLIERSDKVLTFS